jgi:hypothetical protein
MRLNLLIMSQPWDVPPTPAYGDAHADAISLAVGRALTSWEFIEEELAQIFAILVNADMANLERAPAVRAYGSITTARSRSDVLDAAGEAYFYNKPNPQLQSEFDSVLNHYRGFAARPIPGPVAIVINLLVGGVVTPDQVDAVR